MPSTRHSEASTAMLESPGVEAGFAVTTPGALVELVGEQLDALVEEPQLVSATGPWVQLTALESRARDRVVVWVRARAGLTESATAELLDAAERLRPSTPPAVLPLRHLGCTLDLIWLTATEHPGSALSEWYGAGQVPSVASAQTFLGLVLAPLQAMHAAGMVHGALSVASFHRDSDGVVRILRPGVDVPILRADLATGASSSAAAHAAPEVRAGDAPVAASDQYALAAMLVALLTGRPPGDDGQFASDDVPKTWRPILRRALARAPAHRFPDLGAFAQALRSAPTVEGVARRDEHAKTPARNGAAYVPSAFRPRTGSKARTAPPGAGELVLFPDQAWDAPREPGPRAARAGSPARRALSALILLLSVGALAFLYDRFASEGRSEQAGLVVGLPPAPVEPAPPDPQPRGGAATLPAEPTPPVDGAPPASTPPPGVEREPPSPPTRAVPSPQSRPNPEPAQRATPTVAPAQPPPAPPAVATTPTPQPLAPPGSLSMQTYPWGSVYIDGRYVGTTPLIELSVPAGPHEIRVEREGMPAFVRDVTVQPGQTLRLTGIVLGEPDR